MLFLFIIHLSCLFQNDFIKVSVPTAEDEANQVWQTLMDIPFFEEHGYSVSLPRGPLMQSLQEKALLKTLSNSDYEELKVFMRANHNDELYAEAFEKVLNRESEINQMVQKLRSYQLNWDLLLYDQYKVTLTLYGAGGRYNSDTGDILLYCTSGGQFKQYEDPANTIIHEIVHIDVEESIVQALALPHGSKERVVDTFVKIGFSEYLSQYQIQNMGDHRINEMIKTENDLIDLKASLESLFVPKSDNR